MNKLNIFCAEIILQAVRNIICIPKSNWSFTTKSVPSGLFDVYNDSTAITFDKAHNGFYWNNMLCLQGDFDIIGGETALTEAEVIKVDIFLSCLDLY